MKVIYLFVGSVLTNFGNVKHSRTTCLFKQIFRIYYKYSVISYIYFSMKTIPGLTTDPHPHPVPLILKLT